MTQVSTDLRNTREAARRIRFDPVAPITATNVQDAIQQFGGLIVPNPTSVTFAMSPYTPLPTDRILMVNTSIGPVSIIMPPAAARSGLDLEVKDATGNADPNNITVTFTGGEKRDGIAPVIINNPYGYAKFNPIAAGNYYET